MSYGIRTLAAIAQNVDLTPIGVINNSCMNYLMYSSKVQCSSSASPFTAAKLGVTQINGFANCFNNLKSSYCNVLFRIGLEPRAPKEKRKKVIVLGTGWSSMTFIKHIDITKYDVVVISPKSCFSFTPLLPSACTGVLSTRSCLEPIRPYLCRGGKKVMDYYQAAATEVDPNKKILKCQGEDGEVFQQNYDYLIVGVGSDTNTFGIPGVAENAFFLKDAFNALAIHKKLQECFEKASLPNKTEEEKKKLLSFVIVGGGPTGVETAAEISDYIKHDAKKHYPELASHAKVVLIEMLPKLLPSFNPDASKYTLSTLNKVDCKVELKSRVTRITPDAVHFVDEAGVTHEVPCGFVLWASGIGQVPFAKHILSTIEEQKNNRVIKIDQNLRLFGMPGCYALGDCSWFSPAQMQNKADELYESALASGGPSCSWLVKHKKILETKYPQISQYDFSNEKKPKEILTKSEWHALLKDIDSKFSVPPPTAQTAAQEAAYLAKTFNNCFDDDEKETAPCWNYKFKGQMSYVGAGNAVIQLPAKLWLGGFPSLYVWRAAYLARQFSFENQWQCVGDWLKTSLRGRDFHSTHKKP